MKTFELTVEQLRLIKIALVEAIESHTITTFPEQLAYLNTKSNKFIPKPSKEKLESGEVIAMADPDKTFSKENMKISYSDKVTKTMVYSLGVLNGFDLDGQESEN